MQISPLELTKLKRSDYYLLDVRNQNEQEICLIPGTDRLIPVSQLENRLDDILHWQNKQLIVYCRSGVRSEHACQLLRARGFSRATNLTGGILAYIEQVAPSLPVY